MSLFGESFEKIWPATDAGLSLTNFGKELLKKCIDIQKPTKAVNIDEFMLTGSNFPLEFGTNTCRVISQPIERHNLIAEQICSAYPVIHERCVSLYLAFLEHKCRYGNEKERTIYKNLTLTDFVQRLLTKRCAAFFGKNDRYLLLSRHQGCSGFETVGTTQETPPLLLNNVLSYDEIKLSALLSVSSYSEFINNGNRQNRGVVERSRQSIEQQGVVVGIIGARLSRLNLMEFQDIVITKTQNTEDKGYGLPLDKEVDNRLQDYRRVWNNFYEEADHLYGQVKKDNKRFGNSGNKNYIFDNLMMKKRYTISFDTLLLDSNKRAQDAGKQAYIHVVGIGLGVWKVAEQQEKIFLETFTQRLKTLIDKLPHIDVVHFSWFHLNEWQDLKHGGIIAHETHPSGGIKTFLSKRNPADKLPIEYENSLLIVSYAWDGNALPGNEFWMKKLASTGDSSTACSTLITELHNPHINSDYVNGNNLHIASPKYGLLHISEYAQKFLAA